MAPSNFPQYNKDEKVLCFHHELLYEAKVLDYKHAIEGDKKSPYQYRVHYKGWKNTYVNFHRLVAIVVVSAIVKPAPIVKICELPLSCHDGGWRPATSFCLFKQHRPSVFLSSSYSVHLSTFRLSRPTSKTLLFLTLPTTPTVALSAIYHSALYVLLSLLSRISNLVKLPTTLAVVPPATCPITHHHHSSSFTRTSTLLKPFPSPTFYSSLQHSPSSSSIALALRLGSLLILVQH